MRKLFTSMLPLRNRKNGIQKSIQKTDTPTLKIMTVCDMKDLGISLKIK
nr:MAG TPA: hypothetical protein [Caudoviricetes sp.]